MAYSSRRRSGRRANSGSGARSNDNVLVGNGLGLQFNTSGREALRNLVVATDPEAWMLVFDTLERLSPSAVGTFRDNVYRQPFGNRFCRHNGSIVGWDLWRAAWGQDEGARFELHYEKARNLYGADAKPFEAALGAGDWTTRDLADATLARVVALTADRLTVRDIAEELGISKSQVARLQAKAKAEAVR